MKNDKDFLVVSEKFTSIQGEGRTIGFKSIFLRLAGCNILCKSPTWICDTIEVWKTGTKVAFEDVFTAQEIQKLKEGFHLVITGGEPLLHQNKLCEFLYYFKEKHNFLPILEIETNGTLSPQPYLTQIVDYWNVSPKLTSSGADGKRFNEEALLVFNKLQTSIFKFVVSNGEDINEICQRFGFLNQSRIWLMPAGSDREQLDAIRPSVVKLALTYNYNFSDRLHIVIWNQKTGV